MADPFLGEIRMFAGNFAPYGWVLCAGQPLPITQYAALYSLLGTAYGGNGTTNFCVPDLRGRFPAGMGTSVTGSDFPIGSVGGVEAVQLTVAQLPPHSHPASGVITGSPGTASIDVTATVGTLKSPVGNLLAASPDTGQVQALLYAPPTSSVDGQLAGVTATSGTQQVAVTIGQTGGGSAVPTMSPYQTINFIMATIGLFPSRG